MKDFHTYVSTHSRQINSLAKRLQYYNQDYSTDTIVGMLKTAIWESENVTLKGLYFTVLNRILEEKGCIYTGKEFVKLTVPLEEGLTSDPIVTDWGKIDYQTMLDDILSQSKLEEVEVFVIAASNQLSTPSSLTGKYKKIMDNLDCLYNIRPLTHKEIATLIGTTPHNVSSIKQKAMAKIMEFCENK